MQGTSRVPWSAPVLLLEAVTADRVTLTMRRRESVTKFKSYCSGPTTVLDD
jgi:hypothetical protein